MSLPVNDKKNGKSGVKNQKNTGASGSKFIAKATKSANVGKKPIKTGGSRGS